MAESVFPSAYPGPGAAPAVAGGAGLLAGYGRGVAWTYLSLALGGLATLVVTAWSIRRVGPGEFGQFAVVTSITALLAVFDHAIGVAVQRSAARAERDAVHAGHGAFALAGAAVAVAAVVAWAAVAIVGPAAMSRLPATVVLLGLAAALQLGTAALPAVATGCRWFSARSAATVAGLAVRVVVALATVGRLGVPALGLAQLAGVVTERLVLLRLLRRRVPWFVTRPSAPGRAALRGMASFTVPLLVLSVSGQLFAVSDLLVVGAVVGASAVGVYQAAALLPLQLGGFLMLGYDVAFPALSASDDASGQEAAASFLTSVFTFGGGAALGVAALLRGDVVELVLGRPSALGQDVVLAFCAVSLGNLALHGPVSLLIARGHPGVVARLVAVELPVNLVLTVAAVLLWGAAGAALATLATSVLMDFVVFPLATRGRFARPVLDTVAHHGLVPAALGVLVALAATLLAGLAVPGAGASRLALGAALAAVLAAAAGLLLLGPSGRATLRQALAPGARPPVSAVTA